jgi:hypothetical protein
MADTMDYTLKPVSFYLNECIAEFYLFQMTMNACVFQVHVEAMLNVSTHQEALSVSVQMVTSLE